MNRLKISLVPFERSLSRTTITHLLKFHTKAEKKIRRPLRQFVTLRVVQFVLKIGHLAISMELRGLRACGLLPRLWLLVDDHIN